MEDFAKAVELASDEAQRHRFKSYLHLARHEFSAAFEEVQQALKLCPDDPTNYHQHAYVLFKLSNSLGRSSQQQEMEAYNKVLELGYDRLSIIYNNIGYVHYERANFPEALKNFNKSVELCPYHVRAYYNRSTIWEEMREWKNAISDYDAILNINSQVYDAYYFRSKCYARLLNREAAIKDCLYSLRNNRSHVPSLNHLYQLFLETGNVSDLLSELDSFEATCREEKTLFSHLLEDKPDRELLKKQFVNFKAPFTFGKKKLERHRDLLVQMLHRLYTCRGQTRLLVADFEGARADYNSMMQLSLAGWTNSFFYHCIEEIDLEAVQPGTLAICKDLMQTGFTRRNLSTFVSALDRKLSNKSSYTMLPTVADKFYFLACYSFRRLRLYRAHNNDDIFVSFCDVLQTNDVVHRSLQLACSDPFVLSTLFEAYYSNTLLFTSSFLNSFHEIFTVHGSVDESKTTTMADTSMNDSHEQFFQECRQLVVSYAKGVTRGNGD